MTSRREFFKYAGIAGGAVAATAVSRVAMAALPEPVIQSSPQTMAPPSAEQWSALQPRRHTQWLDFALAHEPRCQRVSSGGGTGST